MIEGIVIPVFSLAIAGLSIGITLIVLVVRGSFMLGRLSNQVDGLTVAVGEMRAEIQRSNEEWRAAVQRSNEEWRAEMQRSNEEWRAEMQRSREEWRAEMQQNREEMRQNNQAQVAVLNELRDEVQQSNRTLAALANHTHDTDGRTVFQVPPPVSR